MLANSLRGVRAITPPESGRHGPAGRERDPHREPSGLAIIWEGATQKLQDVIVAGKGQGVQFMDDAIQVLLQTGALSPHEAFKKAIDKGRFREFLRTEEKELGNAAGSAPDDQGQAPGGFREGEESACAPLGFSVAMNRRSLPFHANA